MNLLAGERLDELNWRNLKIIQRPEWFCFSLDAVLLAHFATIRKKDQVADLGTGTGVLPLLLWAKEPTASFTGLELWPEVADMASRTVALNNLQGSIKILCQDLKDCAKSLPPASFSLVVANPPYAEAGRGRISANPIVAGARTEIYATLADTIAQAAYLLNSEGRLALAQRPQRLDEVLHLMHVNQILPKRLLPVQSQAGQEPYLVLVEGIKGGKPGLKMAAPLTIYRGLDYTQAALDIMAGPKI